MLQKKWAEISGICEKTRIEKVNKQSEWIVVFSQWSLVCNGINKCYGLKGLFVQLQMLIFIALIQTFYATYENALTPHHQTFANSFRLVQMFFLHLNAT